MKVIKEELHATKLLTKEDIGTIDESKVDKEALIKSLEEKKNAIEPLTIVQK